jgi:uncharacterized RDD family membrane protein YckC
MLSRKARGGAAIGDQDWSYALELEGRRVELAEGESSLGRSRSCTVTLRDPSASRNHAVIVAHPGDVRARDLGSSNGTYLNGERLVGERPVSDGDRITIGETEIVVRVVAPVVPMADVGATVRLEDAALQCPGCGAELPVHAEFCPHCGHRMGAEPMVAATTRFEPGMAGPGGPPPPPPPAAGMAPPAFARTEIYREPQPVAPPPPPVDRTVLEPFGGDILPSIGDAEVRPPGPAPAPPPGPPVRPPAAPRPAAAMPAARAPHGAAAPAAALGYRPAGFWIRLVAALIDGIWISLLLGGASLPFGGPLAPNGQLVVAALGLLVGIVVPVLGWATVGATPGKLLTGLRVIGGGRRRGIGLGRALMRLCGMWVSAALLGLGFLMVAFTRDKRALHDHLAGTAVMRR